MHSLSCCFNQVLCQNNQKPSGLQIILTILPLPGELASLVSDPVILPYSSIPGFPVSTAPGHSGKLVFGTLSGASVVLMQVRLRYSLYNLYHPYPGLPACVVCTRAIPCGGGPYQSVY